MSRGSGTTSPTPTRGAGVRSPSPTSNLSDCVQLFYYIESLSAQSANPTPTRGAGVRSPSPISIYKNQLSEHAKKTLPNIYSITSAGSTNTELEPPVPPQSEVQARTVPPLRTSNLSNIYP
jgi:hypothetical protein